MDYMTCTQRTLHHIERHLRENIAIEDISSVANYSPFHLQRIFKHVVGDSVKDYVRKRRMTEAAKLLVGSNQNTVDIGCEFGYQSREAFSRAFKRTYGMTPTEVRQLGMVYQLRAPLTLPRLMAQYRVRQGFQPRTVYRPRRFFNGKEYPMRFDGSHFIEGPKISLQWNAYDYWADLSPKRKKNHEAFIGIHSGSMKDGFFIGGEIFDIKQANRDMDILEAPEGWYVSFKTKIIDDSAEQWQKFSQYVYFDWWDSQPGLHHSNLVMEETYFLTNKEGAEEFYLEISIPMQPCLEYLIPKHNKYYKALP